MPGLRYNTPFTPPEEGGAALNSVSPQPKQPFSLNQHTNMEYWEVTKSRSLETLPIWKTHLADLKVNGKAVSVLEGLIDQFEPLAQARTQAQDEVDEAFRAVQAALLKMKILGIKLPQMIESQLDEEEGLMSDVTQLYGTNPRAESSILKRARELYPVWLRANAVLAAATPPLPPLIRSIAGVQFAVAGLKSLLDGFTDLTAALGDKEELLNQARTALRNLDAQADRLNKNWYKYVKGTYDPGDPAYDALEGITTEPSTPSPEPVEIATVTQGGDEGREVLVAYEPGGGAHATTKQVQWKVDGVDEDFTHTAPLDASGNALGPFEVGKVVHLRTLVSNSAGSRTTAPRTITIAEAIA
jgi:hypothetical protein